MSDNYYRPDDHTEAIPPYPPQQGQGQGSQGKLVLGSFQQQPHRQQAPGQRPQQPGANQNFPGQQQQRDYAPRDLRLHHIPINSQVNQGLDSLAVLAMAHHRLSNR
ncbi:hypothetical protein KDW_01940 [Dictyobacter vulcani]|uniref:Uncharacterized protein n=1 Tax=Dictyobacter vulcani TaxID=2607529 RepID=A0A5J4KGX8_9CHLR|nr:hypothetical protein [Dictyobacter vulcani]GER86032.1 hypothetical protein KDW_01940 [Dictyobacter vulcani]